MFHNLIFYQTWKIKKNKTKTNNKNFNGLTNYILLK